MVDFKVDEERCIGCGECAADCPAGVIAMEELPVMTDAEGCYRCQHCLAVCPSAALSILGVDPDSCLTLAGNEVSPERLAALIKGRRSVRRYKDRDLAPELIDELLETAWHAPTGVNSQGVLFTVVRERKVMAELRTEVMDKLAEIVAAGKLPEGFVGQYLSMAARAWQENGNDVIFRGAPHLLLASAPKSVPSPLQDTHIALTTFQLFAHAHGLGTVWDGMVMMVMMVWPEFGDRLGIPADHQVGYAMVFGEPDVEYHRAVRRGPPLVNVVR